MNKIKKLLDNFPARMYTIFDGVYFSARSRESRGGGQVAWPKSYNQAPSFLMERHRARGEINLEQATTRTVRHADGRVSMRPLASSSADDLFLGSPF